MTTVTEGRLVRAEGETWYRVVGELRPDAAQLPLVILHGGPGAAHNYCEPIADLVAQTGRAVVLYDQLGCGLSRHLPEAPVEFWTPQLFKDELVALTEHLGIAGRYAVLGQSWGGMLGMEHALDRPAGLRALVVADSPASMRLWVAEANRLRALLPPEVEATLQEHEAAGTTDDAAYVAAVQVFYDRHLCRVPAPPCGQASVAQMFHMGRTKLAVRLAALDGYRLMVDGVLRPIKLTIIGDGAYMRMLTRAASSNATVPRQPLPLRYILFKGRPCAT